MCPAFPDSDYYEGSAPERARLRSSRLARFLPGRRFRFPCSDFQPLCLQVVRYTLGDTENGLKEARPFRVRISALLSREH